MPRLFVLRLPCRALLFMVCSWCICLLVVCLCVGVCAAFYRTSGVWVPCTDAPRPSALFLHCSQGRGGLYHGARLAGGEDEAFLTTSKPRFTPHFCSRPIPGTSIQHMLAFSIFLLYFPVVRCPTSMTHQLLIG